MNRATFIKPLIFRFCIGLLTFILGLGAFIGWEQIKGSPHSDELTLRFVADTQVVTVDESPTVKLYITNNGKDTVTLVHPGDGSEVGWRTPAVQWSILEAGDRTEHYAGRGSEHRLSRCGNIESLRWDDVFRLAPGETQEMKVWLPRFEAPGQYRVQFFYVNRPWMEWSGVELGMHNPIAMWRVKHSTACSLNSNEILFTVNE